MQSDNEKIKISKPGVIVIVGQTSSGKSDLGVRLAKKFNGEIISADSRQIYRGMDIGSGKIAKKEMRGIPHYLLNVASPKTKFTVVQYRKKAYGAIKIILKRHKIPFVVGGTGFYVKALTEGINLPGVKPDWKLRKKLGEKSIKELFSKVKKFDPARAKTIESKNKRRLIRALEIILTTGKPVPSPGQNPPPYEILMLGIKKSKRELERAIKKRLLKRLRRGMLMEVKKLHTEGVSWKRLEKFGLEYRYCALYWQKKLDYKEIVQKLQKEIENYAKRQMAWWKKDERIHWIKTSEEAEKLLKNFLEKKTIKSGQPKGSSS